MIENFPDFFAPAHPVKPVILKNTGATGINSLAQVFTLMQAQTCPFPSNH
jgi:hypothetical protein